MSDLTLGRSNLKYDSIMSRLYPKLCRPSNYELLDPQSLSKELYDLESFKFSS